MNTRNHHDVFISYKRENSSFVSKISKELSNPTHEISAWVDLDELYKKPAKEYTEIIHNAIDNAKLFLLVYTKEVESSDFIIDDELAYAISKSKPIFVFPQDPLDSTSRIFKDVGKLQWLSTKETSSVQTDIQEALYDSRRREDLSRLTGHGFTTYDDQNVFLIRLALQRELGKITPFGNYTKLAGSDSFYHKGLAEISVVPKGFYLSVPDEYHDLLVSAGFLQDEGNSDLDKMLANLRIDTHEIYGRLLSFINKNEAYNNKALYSWLSNQFSLEKAKYNSIHLPKEDLFPQKNSFA